MEIWRTLYYGVAILGMLFCLYMLRRNNQIHNLRIKVLWEIEKKKSLKSMRLFNSITYEDMLRRCFTPISQLEKEWRRLLDLK